MYGEKAAQSRDLLVADGVGVDADGPQAARFFNRRPQLLRNPGDAVEKIWPAGKPV
jgi:hypothetical protein